MFQNPTPIQPLLVENRSTVPFCSKEPHSRFPPPGIKNGPASPSSFKSSSIILNFKTGSTGFQKPYPRVPLCIKNRSVVPFCSKEPHSRFPPSGIKMSLVSGIFNLLSLGLFHLASKFDNGRIRNPHQPASPL